MFLFPIRKKEFEVLYTYDIRTTVHILQKIAFSQGPTYHRVCYVYDKHNVQYPKSKQSKKIVRKLYYTKSFDWMIKLQIFFA